MTDSSHEPHNRNAAELDETARSADSRIEKEQHNKSKNKENCGTDDSGTNKLAEINKGAGLNKESGPVNSGNEQQVNTTVVTNVDELSSDGSASAFEGTESIDSHEQDLYLKRKAEQLKNDPSGRSNY